MVDKVSSTPTVMDRLIPHSNRVSTGLPQCGQHSLSGFSSQTQGIVGSGRPLTWRSSGGRHLGAGPGQGAGAPEDTGRPGHNVAHHIWAAHRVNYTRSMRIPCRGTHSIEEPCRPQSRWGSCAKGEEHPLVKLSIGQVSWVSVPYHITPYHAILDGATAPIAISRAVGASPGIVQPLG
jgi:hypothetical protein